MTACCSLIENNTLEHNFTPPSSSLLHFLSFINSFLHFLSLRAVQFYNLVLNIRPVGHIDLLGEIAMVQSCIRSHFTRMVGQLEKIAAM